MTDMQTLFKIVNDLSAEEWAELKDYLEKHPPTEPPIRDPQAPRILGLLAGGWVSEDFDDELPDEFSGFGRQWLDQNQQARFPRVQSRHQSSSKSRSP